MNFTFVSDIDGTLIKTNRPLHPCVVDAAASFSRAGGRLSLCTGRDISSTRAIAHALPVNAPCILYGGAMIYDFSTETILWKRLLNSDIIDVLDGIYRAEPSVSITVYSDKSIYMLRTNQTIQEHGVYEDRTAPACTLSEIDGDLLKVLLTCEDPDVLERLRGSIISPDLYEYTASGKKFYEISPKDADKGKTLLRLAGWMNLPEHHFFAAGDAATDLSMKESAELFFVPETAPADIRKLADIIIPGPLEGGMAQAFEQAIQFVNRHRGNG